MVRAPLWLQLLALLAATLLLAGMVTPLLTLSRLWMFNDTLSILGGVSQLWQQKHYLLFLLITTFSVLLPLLKLVLLLRLLTLSGAVSPRARRYLHLMHEYGRWAMLDVMVVAMLLVTVKLGIIVRIQIHFGLYLFAAGVLLTMLVTRLTLGRLNAAPAEPAD